MPLWVGRCFGETDFGSEFGMIDFVELYDKN
jgi:hypothetical protein